MTNPSTISGSARMGGRLNAVMLAAVLASAGACGTKDAEGPLQPRGPTGRVRFVNLITDTTRGRVNAILENTPFGVNLTHGMSAPASLPAPASAPYAPIYTGVRTLVMKRTIDTSVTVATIPFTVTAGQDQTIYATGGAGATPVTPVVMTDANVAVLATEVRFRVVNMTTGSLDVFITAPGANLATATPSAAGLAPQGVSSDIVLPAGSYQIRMVPAGTAAAARAASVVIDIPSPAAAYAGGSARTIVAATSNIGGTPLKGIVLVDR